MPIFGDNTPGGDTFPCSDDRALFALFTLPVDGDITQMNVIFDTSSTAGSNAKALIYSDVAGNPSVLLAASAGVAVPGGGGDITFPMTVSLPAGDYWLGCVTDSFQCVFDGDTGSGVRIESFTYASPQDPVSGTIDGKAFQLDVYATYDIPAPPPSGLPTYPVSSELYF